MKILLIIILLFQTGIGFAQNIEITVLNKNSIPMPYAFILINGKPITVSDTLGHSMIPINKLKDNDTISVSYLGASPTRILYDESLKESKKHVFFLDESVYNLNEVVVTYQDIEKFYKKSIISIPEINYNCSMTAKFDAKIIRTNQTVSPASGTFEAENEWWPKWPKKFTPGYYGYFHHPLKFITNSDTTKISGLLNYHIHFVLDFINMALRVCRDKPLIKYKPFYSFLGEKDNFKIFRISYPKNYLGYPLQVILYVDKDTKYIRSLEIEAISAESEGKKYLTKFSLSCNCEPFTYKKPHMNTVYLPVVIQYNAQTINGLQADIRLSDFTLKPN